jgi:hypothetical protein
MAGMWTSDPLLLRSERELEEANRKRRMATSLRVPEPEAVFVAAAKVNGVTFQGSCAVSLRKCQTHLSRSAIWVSIESSWGLAHACKQRIVPDEAAYRH